MASPVVLVVDDEALIRMLIIETLRDAGFDVLEAEDASSALEVLRRTPDVALLCTDVRMPGDLDGVDLALRVAAWRPDVRLMIISASNPGDARLSGVTFLAKPFPTRRLAELALGQLAAPPQRRSDQTASRPEEPRCLGAAAHGGSFASPRTDKASAAMPDASAMTP